METTGDLIPLPANYLGNLFKEDPNLESLSQLFPLSAPIQLSSIILSFFGVEGSYDLTLSLENENEYLLNLTVQTSAPKNLNSDESERKEAESKEVAWELNGGGAWPSAYLEEVAGGDNAFMADLITVFIDETPITLAKLEHALAIEDAREIIAEAHRYKANLRYMGLENAYRKMDAVENAAGQRQWEKIRALLAEIKETAMAALPYLATTVEEIRTTLKTNTNE